MRLSDRWDACAFHYPALAKAVCRERAAAQLAEQTGSRIM